MDCDAERPKAIGSQPCAANPQPRTATAADGQAAAECGGSGPAVAAVGRSSGRDGVRTPDRAVSPGQTDVSKRLPDPGLTTTVVASGGKAVPGGCGDEHCSSPPPLRQDGRPATSAPPSFSPGAGGDIIVPQTPESQVRFAPLAPAPLEWPTCRLFAWLMSSAKTNQRW